MLFLRASGIHNSWQRYVKMVLFRPACAAKLGKIVRFCMFFTTFSNSTLKFQFNCSIFAGQKFKLI